jgi:3-carboxy-cis,cis-muconate cycloisomerase
LRSEAGFDHGLLTPVSSGADALVSDAAMLAAFVTAEVALVRAWRDPSAETISRVFGWSGGGQVVTDPGVDLDRLVVASVAGGNPVIPLVGALRARLDPSDRPAVHRGATSQDILDSALMLLARRAVRRVLADLVQLRHSLAVLAVTHRDTVTVARTLTQHAVPTTVGARVASWIRSLDRSRSRLETVDSQLPAQLGGAGGTLAAFVAHADHATASRLPAAFAAELGLAAPDAPWHTVRWPVTELGDALVQTADALGVFAADVAMGARTEIGEWIVGAPGGSSAMPHKRNPAAAVLVRSAVLRAPHLGATLHAAAGAAVDERPDGAWHAEWPALRELLRLVLGAATTARDLAAGLSVDTQAVARNLALTGGLALSERVTIELTPVLGSVAVAEIIARASAGDDLAGMLQAALRAAEEVEEPSRRASGSIGALLDPVRYIGLAGDFVDHAAEEAS